MSDNNFIAIGIGLILLSVAAVSAHVAYEISDAQTFVRDNIERVTEAQESVARNHATLKDYLCSMAEDLTEQGKLRASYALNCLPSKPPKYILVDQNCRDINTNVVYAGCEPKAEESK